MIFKPAKFEIYPKLFPKLVKDLLDYQKITIVIFKWEQKLRITNIRLKV